VAVIYRAQIRPTKLELIGSWLPTQPWFDLRSVDTLESLGAYRFDDPAGDVGIETLLVEVAGDVVQVPMTYRGAPLAGAQEWLMGTMEHTVLGPRWVYDACADPVYANELAAAILTGGTQADEFVEGDDGPVFRVSTVAVKGSGSADGVVVPVGDVGDLTVSTVGSVSTVTAPTWELTVARLLDVKSAGPTTDAELVGTWAGQLQPVRLASARRR
jgi:Maltokinase N-terminal cap domain